LEGGVSKPQIPYQVIGVFPSGKSQLVAAPHEASDQQTPPASMHQSTNLKVAINKNLESQLLKERAFLKALKVTVAREQTKSTPETRRLLIRQDIMEKEETTNGEYEVDMTKYFKLLSSDVDETIFEEE
jgi:hypothetical protein